MASVMEGFLVKLGFAVDKDGMKRFNNDVAETAKRFKSVAKQAAAVGAAVTAAFSKAVYDTSKAYVATRNVGSSIEGFQKIANAVQLSGGNVQNVSTAFETLKSNIATYGNTYEQFLKDNFGVSLRDSNNNLRDTSAVFMDLREKLVEIAQTKGYPYAQQAAEAMGLGAALQDIINPEFKRRWDEQAVSFEGFGHSLDENAKLANNLTNSFSRMIDTLTLAGQTVAVDFIKATGLDKSMEKAANWVDDKAPKIVGFVRSMMNGTDSKGNKVDRMQILKEGFFQNVFASAEQVFSGAKLGNMLLQKSDWGKKVAEWTGIKWASEKFDALEKGRREAWDNSHMKKLYETESQTVDERRARKRLELEQQNAKTKQTTEGVERSVTVKEEVKAKGGETPAVGGTDVQVSTPLEAPKQGGATQGGGSGSTGAPSSSGFTEAYNASADSLAGFSADPNSIAGGRYESDGKFHSNYSLALRQQYAKGSQMYKILGYRAMRNNNPGNLVARKGQMHDDQFAIFNTMDEGMYGLMSLLKRYQNAGLENIESILHTYAPQSENDTGSYINDVLRSMKQFLGTDIGARDRLDLSDPRQLYALAMAIINHESGRGTARMLGMGFDKGAFFQQAVNASQTKERFKGNTSKRVESTRNVVVNQNIQVNGAGDPQLVANRVAETTNKVVKPAPTAQ